MGYEKKMGGMRIAIISAVFGGVDLQKPFPTQNVPGGWEITHHHFTEKNSLIPREDFIPRLRAKWGKIIPHHEIDADIMIWMDGSVQVTSPDFVTWIVGHLQGHDIACLKHPDRNSIVDELHFMEKLMSQGNVYLRTRYSREKMRDQVEHYLTKGFSDSVGLWWMCLFARYTTQKVNQAFDRWWIENTTWTIQDQLSFPMIVETHKLNVKTLTGYLQQGMFRTVTHQINNK